MKTKSSLILRCGWWQFDRIGGQLHLSNNDFSTGELFQILEQIKKDKDLDNEDVWNLHLSKEDKLMARPESLLRNLGGNKNWDQYWELPWSQAASQLVEKFGSKIIDNVQRSKTLWDIKIKIESSFGSEDIVEWGLKKGLIKI